MVQVIGQALDVFAALLLEALHVDDLRDQHVIGLTDRLSGYIRRSREIRLGHGLAAAVDGHGVAYRMGGDEFCVLVHGELEACFAALAAASAALSEHGEGFTVTSSCGAVVLPDEADTPEVALRIADQRMYTQKQGGRPSASRQSSDVLLRALAERYPELDDHSHGVAELAAQVARGLMLSDPEVDRVRLAAELHDVGKVAIESRRDILHRAGGIGAPRPQPRLTPRL